MVMFCMKNMSLTVKGRKFNRTPLTSCETLPLVQLTVRWQSEAKTTREELSYEEEQETREAEELSVALCLLRV